jgi:hypothetical protein
MHWENIKIAIIGCGNLGTSIVNGLLDQADFIPQNLHITKRNPSSLMHFQDKGVRVHSGQCFGGKGIRFGDLGRKALQCEFHFEGDKSRIGPQEAGSDIISYRHHFGRDV